MTYIHGTYTTSKRTLQPRKLPKDVVTGIILGVIAVITTAVVILLLLRLRRLWHIERRAANQVDLLGVEAGNPSIPADGSEKVLKEWLSDKPLPPVPSSRGSQATLLDIGYTQAPMNESVIVGQPSQIWSRPGDMGTSDSELERFSRHLSLNIPLSPLYIPAPQLPTKPAHTRTSTISSIGNFRTYNNNPSSGMPQTTSSSVPNIPRAQLTIANATDADEVLFDRSQTPHHNLPSYSTSQTRGRVAPFPAAGATRPQPTQLRSILKPPKVDSGEGMSSLGVTSEKQAIWDARSSTTSYMVQIPIPRISRIPASPVQSQRVRRPLTLTTSRPVSNVVVEDAGSGHQANGSRGKGRMVTMSVLIDDSDNSSSGGGRDSYQDGTRTNRSSAESQYVLGEVLEGYATDLPPYTPVQEDYNVPQQEGSQLVRAGR